MTKKNNLIKKCYILNKQLIELGLAFQTFGNLSLRLDIPSLEFEKNKVNILLGPNGGGKSTLLDCLSLNLPLDGLGREGQIFIEDRELSKYSYHDLSLKMSYIPQQLDWNHSFKVEDIFG